MGFTLIELIVAVGVIAVIAAAAMPASVRLYKKNLFVATTDDLLETLRLAQGRAMQADEGSAWGVRLEEGAGAEYILFLGDDFDERDPDFDEVHRLPDALELFRTTPHDVVFLRLAGTIEDVGTITVGVVGEAQEQLIEINERGVIQRL